MDTPLDTEAEESGSQKVPSSSKKANVALSSLSRQLTDKELSSSGAQKLLLDKLEYLEDELSSLRAIRENFHVVDKDASVLREKMKVKVALEIVTGCALAGGAALIGFASSLWPNQSTTGTYLLVTGGIFSIGAIVAKAVRP